MKLRIAYLIAMTALISAVHSQAPVNTVEENPAYIKLSNSIDVTQAKPTVNVNLPKFLINEALSALDELSTLEGSDQEKVAQLVSQVKEIVKEIQVIQVMVFEDLDNESSQVVAKGMDTLKKELEDSWTTIVAIPDEGINIFAKPDASGEKMAGISVLVSEGNEAVVANIVGRLPLGKIIKLATESRGMDPRMLEEILEGIAGGI